MEVLLERSWGLLGASWAMTGPSSAAWCALGPSWRPLGVLCGRQGGPSRRRERPEAFKKARRRRGLKSGAGGVGEFWKSVLPLGPGTRTPGILYKGPGPQVLRFPGAGRVAPGPPGVLSHDLFARAEEGPKTCQEGPRRLPRRSKRAHGPRGPQEGPNRGPRRGPGPKNRGLHP